MKKLIKIVAFVGAAGAAVAGFWYFLDRKKRDEEEYFECEPVCEEVKPEEHEYVSLSQEECKKECPCEEAENCEQIPELEESPEKKSLKQVVKSAAMEMKQKAEDAARGVGVVADEVKGKASEFAFKAFDKAEEVKEEVVETVEEEEAAVAEDAEEAVKEAAEAINTTEEA